MRRLSISLLLIVACLWASALALSAESSNAPTEIAQAQTTQPPGQGATKPSSPKDTPAATRARTQADPPVGTFSVQAFQTDLFTGAATAQIPIVVPPGTAGVAPKIVLQYNSSVVDELGKEEAEVGQKLQGQWTGLGWTLDIGGFVLRDTKLTTSPNDDTFKLVFGGVSHDLVLVNAGQNIYHTKDETFWELKYNSQSDYWTLKTKDGTVHRFGFNPDSKAIGLGQDLVTPVTYKYLIDEVTTTSGTSVRYSYVKQTATASTGRTYDQAVYPNTITYAYHSGALVGSAREIRFNRVSRQDWTVASPLSFHELERLDSIDVRVGGGLVRKYVFGYDYSIDRHPGHTWGGGATGDLTLKSVTMIGTDGVSTLPPLTFTYSGPVLASASNGIGGTVSYTYERVATQLLFNDCIREPADGGGCQDWGGVSGTVWGGAVVGHILTSSLSGTQPLIGGCARENEQGCQDWWGDAGVLLGYALTTNVPGTVGISIECIQEGGDGGCTPGALGIGTSTGPSSLGYVYAGKVDRHRVTSRTLSDGLGWSSTTNFTYTDLGLSSDGKEFRGHAKVRSTDPLGHYTETFFFQDDAKRGRPYQTEARSSTGALFAQVVNTWNTTNPYPGVTFVSLSRVDNYECDAQPTCLQTAKTFTYDGNGNPTQTYHLGEVAVTGDERDERTEWTVDTATWIHRPSRIALLDNVGAIFRERWLSYDSLGRLTREESRLAGAQGSAGNPAVTHLYDPYGNKISTTDPRGCTTSTTFDSSQTYPATVTTCLGHVTSFQYDPGFGVVTSQTDPNNQTTTSTYDVFGRPTKVTGPLDTASTYGTVSFEYPDWGNTSLQRIITRRTEQHGTANHIWSEEYFDGLGRVDKIRSEGPGTQTIIIDTNYDARGQVSAQSAPYFSTETPVYTQFSYDVLGRQTRVDHPDLTFATTSYVQDVITTTDERGNVKKKYLDAYDRLERVDEINGAETYVTTYQYDVAGSLTRVTNHLNHATTMTYDFMGRKAGMTDPNMGAWSYGYDLGGNLTSQTDAKNQTITFTYDSQSRLLTKTYPNTQQITWTYDDPAVSYSKGRLTRVVDLAGTTNFTYDQLGRVTQTQRTLGGVSHTMSQTYDALGRVASETFPDTETVSYSYNEAGWLSSVPGYINSITYNARGQKTSLQYFNGVTTNWTFNAQNFRVTNRSTSSAAGTFQNLSYAYDNIGNITSITDPVYTSDRTFTYDALNRLTSASGTFGTNQGQTTCNYSYNAIGNITDKCGISYSYADASHPSAVTSTSDGKTYTYDANGNMLTGGNRTQAWDFDNRLSSVTASGSTTSMVYDYTGMRTEKSGALGTTIFPFSGYEIGPGGISVKYIRIGIENVASKKSTGETLFYHNDHLGGVNVITNTSGLLAQLIEYDPWGKVSRSEGAGDSLRRFTGQQLDPESGLYYYGGRYYDPELGRFISPDPFVQAPHDPQNLNRYSYVRNNPVNLIDPSGYSWFSKLFKKIKRFFKAIFKNPVKLFASIAVGVFTGFLAGPAGFGFTGFAQGAIAGAAAGATFAGLSGGNPLLGALSGGLFGGLTGGILGAPVPGADFPAGLSTPALVHAAGGGAGFGGFFGRRGVSAGDDFTPRLVLASGPRSTGEFFRTGDEGLAVASAGIGSQPGGCPPVTVIGNCLDPGPPPPPSENIFGDQFPTEKPARFPFRPRFPRRPGPPSEPPPSRQNEPPPRIPFWPPLIPPPVPIPF